MRIAIFAQNPAGHGGIESVVSQHIRIFREHGCECLLWGQAGCKNVVPVKGEARKCALRKLMSEFRPDVCILHGSTHPGMVDDKVVFDELKIPTVVVCHFSFPSSMLLSGEEKVNRLFAESSRLCDIVATVSKMDALWWRAHGLRTLHVQNPFIPPGGFAGRKKGLVCQDGVVTLIWVGRQAEQKQPGMALAAFARVHAARPQTRLIMVGGSAKGWKAYEKKAIQFGCGDAVEFLPERGDISDLWQRADIHLLTSLTESFCLVLAEAKAHGIPSVMFELPFLELVQGGKGILLAPQYDVVKLADQIIRLLDDRTLYRNLSNDAKDSLAGFNDEAVWNSWMKIFRSLKRGSDEELEIPEVYKQLILQASDGWNAYVRKNGWLAQMEADLSKLFGGHASFRRLAQFLHAIVESLRRIRARVRG